MRVLVTGGAGFVGSHVVDRLVERGDEIVVLDNLDPQVHGPEAREPIHIAGHLKRGSLRFVQGDVVERDVLRRSLEGVEAVIHLAAAVGVGQSMYEPYHYVRANAAGTGLLLDEIAREGRRVTKLIVASSMSLYGEGAYACPACGGSRARVRDEAQLGRREWEVACRDCGTSLTPQPTPEEKPAEIASVYAATKKHQEDLVMAFGRAFGIPSFALRFFNIYGPRQSLSNPYTGVAAIFLSRLLNHKPPLLFEDGRQSRDFIHVEDVTEAILRALDDSGGGAHVLNVGTGRSLSIREVATVLAEKLGLDIRPQTLDRYRAGDVRHCFADTRRAEAVLGFRAKRSFADGVTSLLNWSRGARAQDRVEQCLGELEAHRLVR